MKWTMGGVLLALLALGASADDVIEAPRAGAEPRVVFFRVTDRRGADLGLLVSAAQTGEKRVEMLWLARGIVKDDVIVRASIPRGEGGVALMELHAADRPSLRASGKSGEAWLTVASPEGRYRFNNKDRRTRTVSCHLQALVEEADLGLFEAAEELYGLNRSLGRIFGPAAALLEAARHPGHPPDPPTPPERHVVEIAASPELADLGRAALSALRSPIPVVF